MACETPWRDDSEQRLLFKIASCIASGGGVAGVASFNGRVGIVTLTAADVAAALGCTPLCEADGDARYVLKSGDSMTGALSIDNGSQVASTPYLSLSQTWNNAAVTFTGLQSNVTNTASSSNSNLFNFQVDGVDRFNFTPGGSFRVVRQDASDSGMNLFLRKRGNAGSATGAVANDSTIGTIAYSGWDGAAFATGSRISGLASEAWTGAAHGSRIDIYATPVGSVAEALILRISSTGINLTDALAYQYNAVNVITAQTALNNFFFGPSGNLTMTGIQNTSVGSLAFVTNTTGAQNVAVGYGALNLNTTGSSNTAVGALALALNTTGVSNTAVGHNALLLNTTGGSNLAVGVASLSANSTGGSNVGLGNSTLTTNTTGSNNVAIGLQALFSNTTAGGNVAIGPQALFTNSTGSNNIAVGTAGLTANTTGSNNSSLGYRGLNANTTGMNNVSMGLEALFSSTTSSNNTAVGSTSLFDLTTSTGDNTAIGYNTGRGITTGANNTIIGANVTGLAAALSGTIIIATGAGTARFYSDSAGLSGIATVVPNSTLHVQGSFATAYVAKTAVYTATVSDYTIDCTANTFTVSLPTAVGITGRIYVVKNSGAGVITVDPAGAELIDGLATVAVAAGASVTTQSTGAGWIII